MSKQSVNAIKCVLGIGFVVVVACEVDSCTGGEWEEEVDGGARYCADFEIENDAMGTIVRPICDCVPTGQNAADWLEDVCLDQYDEVVELDGDTTTCTIQNSPAIVDDICDNLIDPPDPTGSLDGTAGDDCGYDPPTCDLYNPETDCCCSVLDPICCAPDDDGCIGTVLGDPNFTAPGASPDYSISLVSGQAELTVHPSTGDEDSDSISVTATASYDFSDCGSALCTIYLADLQFAASETISVDVTLNSVTKTKDIVGFEGRLVYPTLGSYDPSTDDVEFLPNTIVLSLRYEITGSEFDDENDSYAIIVRNSQSVMGAANDTTHIVTLDELSFEIDIPDVDPVVELSYASIALDGRPPVVSSTISSVSCIASNQGRVEFNGTSTDPDSDLDVEMWWIDGSLEHVGSDTFRRDFTNGTHTYLHRAIDERDAFRDEDDLIVVTCP